MVSTAADLAGRGKHLALCSRCGLPARGGIRTLDVAGRPVGYCCMSRGARLMHPELEGVADTLPDAGPATALSYDYTRSKPRLGT
jgi:hypothetical protein